MKKYILIFILFCQPLYADYQYQLAIVAVFRDEAPYLKEWIDFHQAVGVEHFYLFNNLSEDNYAEVLQPYLESGLVELTDWPFEHNQNVQWNQIQCDTYTTIIRKVRGVVKWLAIIDTDEFLFPVKMESLVDFLANYEKYAGVAVNWQMYGTSHVEKVPEGKLMIEMLTLKGPDDSPVNLHVKSIVRPERVSHSENPHFVVYMKGSYQVNSDKKKFKGPFSPYVQVKDIRINHYITRDAFFLYHYKLPRLARRGADVKSFEEYYQTLNEKEDAAIFRFIQRMRS